MPFDAFVKIDGILGESTDDKHKDWIEVLSFSTGVSQPTAGPASTGRGAAAQRANFQDFSVVKTLDKASPKLALACANGTHIKEVTLELCRAGGDKIKYYEIKMEQCLISSYRPGGSSQGGEALPLEEVSIDYGKITWTYIQQKRADGSGGGQVAGGWDLTANKPVK
ncbi:MAG: type VI secretion system tube protein Hcp [Smithella sp.]